MKEIFLMTGFSFIGMLFVPTEDWLHIEKLGYASVAILFYVMAVFFLNSYAGYEGDAQSARLKHVSRVKRRNYLFLTLASIGIFGISALATNTQLFVITMASIVLWAAYYLKPIQLKSILFGGTFAHALGGMLHFHMGYCAFEEISLESVKIAGFFALILCTGHLNHEIMDAEDDQNNGQHTTTVRLGITNALMLRTSFAFLSLLYAFILLYTQSYSMITGTTLITASLIMLLASLKFRHKTLPFQKTTRAAYLLAGITIILEKLAQL